MISRFGPSIQRFLHNVAAGGIGQVINVASQIVLLPLFLHYWSKELYGEWLVVTAVTGLLWSIDSGLSVLAGSRMTVASGAGNWALANTIFQNVLLIQTLLSVFILAAVAGVVMTLNLHNLFGLETISRREASDILLIMIGTMLCGFYFGLLRAAYRACAMEARGVILTNFWKLTDLVFTVLVLVLQGGPVLLAEGLLASVALATLIGYVDVRRRCPEIKIAFARISGSQARVMLIDGLPLLAGQAATAFFLQGYPLLVNRLLGPGAVVTLTAIRSATRVLIQIVQTIGGSSSSELSRTYGRKDWETYLRLMKILAAITFWGSVAALVGLTVFGPWLIDKWSLGKIEAGHGLLLIFALSMACQGIWNACWILLVATNDHHLFSYLYFFATLVGLAIVTTVVHLLGFPGVPVVMTVVDLFLVIAGLKLCRRKLTHVRMSELACIFNPVFYAQKVGLLLKRSSS